MSEALTTEKLQLAWRDSKSIAEASDGKDNAVVVSLLPTMVETEKSEIAVPATAEVLQSAWRESQSGNPQ